MLAIKLIKTVTWYSCSQNMSLQPGAFYETSLPDFIQSFAAAACSLLSFVYKEHHTSETSWKQEVLE